MKLTKETLKQIIKEEVQAVLNEAKLNKDDVVGTVAHQSNIGKVKGYEKSEKGLTAIRKDAEEGKLLMKTPTVEGVQLDIQQYRNAILPKGSLPNPMYGDIHKIVVALQGNMKYNAKKLSRGR